MSAQLVHLGLCELSPAVQVVAGTVAVVDEALIDRTIARARLAPKQRARVLLHRNIDDSLHEMLIALPSESCDVPHINFKSGKSFHVVRGSMAVMLFSDDGTDITACRLGAESDHNARMVRINDPVWHTIIPLSDFVVFIETISGPFTGNQFAPWAPAPNEETAWSNFAARVRILAGQVNTAASAS